ncbi:MAG: hypothetical protein J6S44_05290, partial [Clostridia bacterium]|nr:hypothetical protein [Clostridia bacterium]
MIPFLLILLSSAVSLTEGILIKKRNSAYDKEGFCFTAIVSFFSMLFFVGKNLITNGCILSLSAELLPYALLGGLCYASASFLTYIALGCGSFTLSMLILSYGGLFSIGYGLFFLKEQISYWAIAGIVAILISLFLTRPEKKEGDEKKKITLKWLVCIGISFVGSGMLGVLMRVQQIRFEATLDNDFMIIVLLLSSLLLFIAGAARNKGELGAAIRAGGIWAALAGISNGLTNGLSL